MWRMPVQIYRCVDDLQTKTTDLSITTRRFDKGQLVIGRSIKSWQSYRKLLNKKWNTSSSDRAFRRLTSSIRVCLMQRKRDLGVQHWFEQTFIYARTNISTPVLYTAPTKYKHGFRPQNFDKIPRCSRDSNWISKQNMSTSVSYTHLTLPTICSV